MPARRHPATLAAMPLLFDGYSFTRSQARARGLSRRRLDELRREGAVRSVLHGVYVDAQVPDDLGTRADAVALVLPPGAVVCRRTAAWLHGVDAREPGRHRHVPLLDAAVPLERAPVRRGGVRGVVQDLAVRDVQLLAGVPVTTPLRTAVDLARWLPRRSALDCVDALLHLGLVGSAELAEEVERFRGHPFVEQARDLAGIAEPRTESFGESWLRLRLLDSGFPRLEAQIEVREKDGRPFARLDLGDGKRRKGVEYDGETYHSRPDDRSHDEMRRARLAREFGWEVVGFDKGAVLGRSRALEQAVATLLDLTTEPHRVPRQPPPPDDWDFTGERQAGRSRRATASGSRAEVA